MDNNVVPESLWEKINLGLDVFRGAKMDTMRYA